jgi:ABC-type glycerol-3-phosphate transport system substrate-binding protein
MTKLAIAAVLAMTVSVAAQGVAGTWTMNVDTGPAHGITTMGLTLKEDGKSLSGTFQSPHGDIAVTGEFVDGALRLSTADNAEMSVTFHAKLRDDGTLAGYMSTPRGDMKFTAERSKEQE